MRLDTSQPDVTVVEYRPVFVPGFCLFFAVVGLVLLARTSLEGDWGRERAFEIGVSLVLGGGGFLVSARRDTYRFDRRARELSWTRRGVLRTTRGTVPFDAIERVVVHRGPEADDHLWRVVLDTRAGTFPLQNAFTADEARQRAAATAIEDALAA